ncbi:MAG: protein translocase subunit SecD [Candidatus Kapaibacterium sp.]
MKKIAGKLALILVPVIIALFLLYPTYEAYRLEQKKQAALEEADQAPTRADSAARMERFQKQFGEELQQSRDQRLKLGLDLRGGMYVTLEVDVLRLIDETAQKEAKDEIFQQVIDETAKEAAESDESVIDLFLQNFDQIARQKGKTLISYFDVGDFRDASEDHIVERLEENANQAIDQAQEVIRQRIDKYGVSEPNIQKQGNRRILLELPGVTNESEMRQLLQTTARLEFNLVRNTKNLVEAFYKIDQKLRDQRERRAAGLPATGETPAADETAPSIDTAAASEPADTTQMADADTTAKDTTAVASAADTSNPYEGLSEDQAQQKYIEDHPFTRLFSTVFVPKGNGRSVQIYYMTNQFPDEEEGMYIFRISKDSLRKFQEILTRPEIAPLVPYDIEIAVSAKPDERLAREAGVEIHDLYGLKADPELTGEVVSDARASFDPTTNAPVVLMGMNAEGAERWARITGANIKKRIAIVLDGRVYSAPTVQDKISGGSSQITGMADVQEARLLEIVLKAGALKAPVQIIEERVVGPSLGQDSIRSGFTASGVAFLLVIIFMIAYYNKGGLVADFALLLNVLLIISVLTAFGGTLTLPGIAGIILTIGMAVDANILIFERIREELFKGRSIRSAVDEGFSKALSAIIDSNITTFITGLILFFLGSGPIQGFAMTLMIGIGGTLFTGIMVSRAIIEISLIRGATEFSFGQPKSVNA